MTNFYISFTNYGKIVVLKTYKESLFNLLNPKIIIVLFKTCEIESFGYGLDITFKKCTLFKVAYKYSNTKSGFKFTFYRPLGQKYVRDNMSETDIKIFSFIKKNPFVRASEIAKLLDVSDKTIYRSIKKLKVLGLIVRVGDDYSGYWKIIE